MKNYPRKNYRERKVGKREHSLTVNPYACVYYFWTSTMVIIFWKWLMCFYVCLWAHHFNCIWLEAANDFFFFLLRKCKEKEWGTTQLLICKIRLCSKKEAGMPALILKEYELQDNSFWFCSLRHPLCTEPGTGRHTTNVLSVNEWRNKWGRVVKFILSPEACQQPSLSLCQPRVLSWVRKYISVVIKAFSLLFYQGNRVMLEGRRGVPSSPP